MDKIKSKQKGKTNITKAKYMKMSAIRIMQMNITQKANVIII